MNLGWKINISVLWFYNYVLFLYVRIYTIDTVILGIEEVEKEFLAQIFQ